MKLGDPNAKAERKLEYFHIGVESALLEITLKCTEFTCRCPMTGQPDWATIVIEYQPFTKCVESKSLKLYLESFRDVGTFHEHFASELLDDFVEAIQPAWCTVTAHFNTRGGIAISVKAKYDNTLAGRIWDELLMEGDTKKEEIQCVL